MATRDRTREGALAAWMILQVVAFASPAAAQTVRGTLVNDAGGAPLPGATLTLIDSASVAVDSTVSAADGSFILRTTTPGSYLVYFSHPGYASVPSNPIRLAAGDTVSMRFEVPLVAGVAIRRMGEVIDLEARLQRDIVELCGERPRSWEAGIVIGVVRRRSDDGPLAGAVVRVEAPAAGGGDRFRKATVSSANGVYVICNVPEGTASLRTDLAGYRTDEGPIDVRAGNVAWYDVYLRER